MNRIEKIKGFSNWENVEKIDVGFDNCEKYSFVESNKKYVLKIFDEENNEKKKREINILNKLKDTDLLIPKVISYDKVDDWYYYILSWIQGETIKSLKQELDDSILYEIGEKVGSMMATIHKVCTYDVDLSGNVNKILSRLKIYEQYQFNMKNEDKVIDFIRKNIDDLKKQPITMIHGDLTEDNIILKDGKIGLIDFGSANINYAYYDFHQVQMYNRFFSIPFSAAIIDSYLKQTSVNDYFFKILKIYSAYLSLYKIVWAKKMNRMDLVEEMMNRYLTTYDDYKGFEIDVPTWYTDFDRKKVKSLKNNK